MSEGEISIVQRLMKADEKLLLLGRGLHDDALDLAGIEILNKHGIEACQLVPMTAQSLRVRKSRDTVARVLSGNISSN